MELNDVPSSLGLSSVDEKAPPETNGKPANDVNWNVQGLVVAVVVGVAFFLMVIMMEDPFPNILEEPNIAQLSSIMKSSMYIEEKEREEVSPRLMFSKGLSSNFPA